MENYPYPKNDLEVRIWCAEYCKDFNSASLNEIKALYEFVSAAEKDQSLRDERMQRFYETCYVETIKKGFDSDFARSEAENAFFCNYGIDHTEWIHSLPQ